MHLHPLIPPGALRTSTVLVEFITWFVWLTLFAIFQMRVCRRYPGIQTMCRVLFFATMVVAILPGVWVLSLRLSVGPRLLTLLNRAFGMGVFAQTFLRALFLTNWLAFSDSHQGLSFSPQTVQAGGNTERQVVALLLAFSQAMRGSKPKTPGQA